MTISFPTVSGTIETVVAWSIISFCTVSMNISAILKEANDFESQVHIFNLKTPAWVLLSLAIFGMST
ncbi:hypothetical protein RJT34_16879 [Clitoria ternatea]|uniref:Uncharacterized protein n=1 Tax=Clitoria ternatea TaxID=43366 RepID=A0AAN9J974_CLITE